MKRTSVLALFWFLLGAIAPTVFAATGSIAGNVSNAGTGNLLEGARITLPALRLDTLSDETGRFVLDDVPAGAHEIVVTYLGLDTQKFTVNVTAGQRAIRDFDLTTGVYQLQAFTVTGEREGNAAALTAQRNATNKKDVVALDAYGNLPNMNASELAVLLPGVAGNLSDEGNIVGFTVRGMPPAMNTITIDGALMGSQGGMARATRIHTITGSMFEALEVTKGHTPDKEAGSLGGTVNLKSRSTLSMKEKRRITYNFSGRLAPPGTQQIPLREEHRFHPLFNLGYQEVFDVPGGQRNLGVSVNLFYSEQAVGFFSTTRDFQDTAATPAYVWDYRTQDNYNNRKQSSVNAKLDYRLSANSKFSLNLIYNDAFERFRLRYLFRAFTGNQSTVPNATTSGVIPGFTSRLTEVRPVAASTIDITSQMSHFYHRQRHVDFGGEHTFGRLELDYNAVFSPDHINGGGEGGVLVNRVTGVGWKLDRTQSDLYPRFIQNGGPDIANPASYRPNSLNFAEGTNIHEIREVRGNARYRLTQENPIYLKTGFRLREETAGDISRDRRSIFTGTNSAQLPTDPTIVTYGDRKTGLKIPAWNANAISVGRAPVNAALWRDDVYFAESQKFIGTREVTETVTAGYLMTQGTWGRTGFIAGVRGEKTEDDSWGWVRARVGSTAAQQAADPVGSAQRDYANTRREISGSYSKLFPSAHLTRDLLPNLKARLSWSNSFGRPPLSNLLPNETINETAQTLTINNPSLKPQTAESWDAALEYYFEPVGSLSVSWFHKTIKDYFVNGVLAGTVGSGADNGYNGEYSGFTILTRDNLGTAIVQGWELAYQQQFTFLPGLLKTLGVSANTTILETHGDFGSTTATRKTGEVPGFVPRTANLSLSWRYRKFGTRLNVNRTGEYINAFTAAGSGRNQYTLQRTVVNVGAAYQFRPAMSFSVDVGNIFNEAQVFYRGVSDNISEYRIPGVSVTIGVSGRF